MQDCPHLAMPYRVISIANIGTQHQSRFYSLRALQQIRLSIIDLNRVGLCSDQALHYRFNILKPLQKIGFVSDTVIDCHVQTAAVAE